MVEIDPSPNPLEMLLQREERQLLHATLRRLTVRQEKILRLYLYGEKTSAEIGDIVGLSRARVYQIRVQSLGYMRALLRGLPGSYHAENMDRERRRCERRLARDLIRRRQQSETPNPLPTHDEVRTVEIPLETIGSGHWYPVSFERGDKRSHSGTYSSNRSTYSKDKSTY